MIETLRELALLDMAISGLCSRYTDMEERLPRSVATPLNAKITRAVAEYAPLRPPTFGKTDPKALERLRKVVMQASLTLAHEETRRGRP